MWGSKNFYFGDNISVGVRDVGKAVSWYREKLGLRLSPLKFEDCDALLVFSKDVGPLQRDSGGNSYFQFQDVDGNTIEVCIEP